jgi:4-amino-4-deoxy-L-arabinose transferase-like glycosyltransferase
MKFFADFLTNRDNSEKRDLALLLIVFGVAFLQFLGRVPLTEPDEGRYAEIPREMLELGDFITPHLNYVKYFEKPPLHYWLTALSFKIFGENEFAARFPGALMGLLAILLTYHVGRRLFGRREGLLAALILGTSIGFITQGRIDIIDMTLTCTLSAALAFFILAAREGESRTGIYYHLFYFFAALAVLAKGLIGIVFPGAIIFLYLLSSRNWRVIKEMRLPTGILLFLLVCAPWFIMVSLKNPEFPHFFFIREHFERFTTTIHHRNKGIWFFVPVLLATMLPWSFFIPAAVRGVWRERQSAEGKARLYLFIWAAFIFIFFSISDSQLEPYILPIFPALALLMGSAYGRFSDSVCTPLRIQGLAISVILIIGGIGVIAYPHVASSPGLTATGAALIGCILLFEGILTVRNIYRTPLLLFTGLVLCSYLVALATPNLLFTGMANRKSLKELGNIIRDRGDRDSVVSSFGLLQGLPFYAKRRVVVVGDPGEAEFGSKQGDNSQWFMDPQRFVRLWDSPRHLLTVLPREKLAQWQGTVHNVPRIVAEKGKYILISNR